MKTGTWLSIAFASAILFVVGCAAPSGGYAKKRSRSLAYARDSGAEGEAYPARMKRKKALKRRMAYAAEAATDEPAPEASASAPAAQAGGLRLCLAAATKADFKLAYVLARDIGMRGPSFQSVQVASEGGQEACDIVATVAGEGAQPANSHSLAAVSAYTRKQLLAGQSTDASLEGVAADLANQVFEAFKKGTPLYEQVLAQRAGKPAAGASAQAPSGPQATAPTAPSPPPERKPLTDAQRQEMESQFQP